MPSVFFKINTTDLSQYEDKQNHNINAVDVYSTWTDGNWKDHRVIARTRITGTLKLGFANSTDFSSFLTLLTTARNANGYYPIKIYVANTGTEETVNAFLDVSVADKWDSVNSRQWHEVTVKVSEV